MRASTAGDNKILDAAVGVSERKERTLLLLSARSRLSSEASKQLDGLVRAEPNWPLFHRLTFGSRLAGMAYRTLSNAAESEVPASLMRQLRGAYFANQMMMQTVIEDFTGLQETLATRSIPIIVIKGPALAAYAYGDFGLRKTGDLDLLVRKSDFVDVSRLLIERGYVVDNGYQQGLTLEGIPAHIATKKGVTFYGKWCPIDLHWTLDEYPLGANLDMRKVWDRRNEIPLGDRTSASTICDEDLVTFLCCHGAKHSWESLDLVCDLAELLRNRRGIDWEAVAEGARAKRRERMLHIGLLLASELLEAPLPEDVRRQALSRGATVQITQQVAGSLFEPVKTFRIHALRLFVLERQREKLAYLAHRWRQTRR